MKTLRIAAFAVALAFGGFAARAEDAKPYIDNQVVDLLQLLPPPPANDSDKTRNELGQVMMIQVTRSPEQAERAKADDEETVWRFADVIGPELSQDKLPHVALFFDRIAATEGAVVDPAKKVFGRPRPYQYSDLVRPLVEKSKSAAWPSGHATLGTLIGIELSNMVPERRAEIMDRAWEYATNRVTAGMHFPSDVEMGRISGTVIAMELTRSDEFKSDFEAAKKELRAALRLGA